MPSKPTITPDRRTRRRTSAPKDLSGLPTREESVVEVVIPSS
ncbi:MAG: hypothetical protein QOH61_2771, partial [Chloroflexota bacterium]|nr:hypothetical protein [Chloroflexota bacterium]